MYCHHHFYVQRKFHSRHDYDEYADLREDKRYLADYPGLVPVTSEQVQ